jgi:uncharacterized membrane protein
VIESIKKVSIKAICYSIYHVTIAALIFSTVIYFITGKWEYEYLDEFGIGLLGYILWELLGYSVFEMIWPKIEKAFKRIQSKFRNKAK